MNGQTFTMNPRMHLAAALIVLALQSPGVAQNDFSYTGEAQRDIPAVAWSDEGKASAPGDRVRVAFYNIENFNDAEGDGPERTRALAEEQARGAAALIEEIAPDILVLSELENETALALLNQALTRPYPFGWVTKLGDGTTDRPKLNFGLLSRLKPVDLLELDFGPLQGRGRPTRGSLRATFDLGDNHRLVVYGVHLKSNYGHRPRNIAQRKHALRIVASDAQALAADTSVRWEKVLVGDMNVDPEAREFEGDASLSPLRGWSDLWRGRPLQDRITVPTRYGIPDREFPPVTFDRIFAAGDATNAPWRVGEAGVLQQGVHTKVATTLPGVDGHISDHYPIWVDLHR
jgi:endonuclease/exonuclease/phosphatase family metal-dependent hydrolase